MSLIKALPFMTYTVLHGSLAYKQQIIIFSGQNYSPAIAIPFLMVACGGLLDNVRLAMGALRGPAGASLQLADLCFFLHYVIVPLTFTSLAYIAVGMLQGYDWLMTGSYLLTAAFVVHGLVTYHGKVAGNYALSLEGGIAKWTVDRSKVKVTFDMILPVMLIGLFGVIVGAIGWWQRGWAWLFFLQLAGFLGQAMVPSMKAGGMYLSNFLEVVFLASMMATQI
ncbi:uncharacterized protein LOC106155447 [Lingula anatina]|uniref:Uncharacterized protein LOC106155447 n=1 Tax=Lingula anatina TaxID=7574 RepID=A0A1S3HL78_LINAN|nr:uncharacterized protein LOC106155447 [Lingula anatina]|eukprot:XP_013385764.1 uncharacterized protein LOC106155447 [Lingula anatina]